MIAQHDREAGFTLVEALVSLFVFALVAGGCVAMLGQTVEAQGRVGDAQQELRVEAVARVDQQVERPSVQQEALDVLLDQAGREAHDSQVGV